MREEEQMFGHKSDILDVADGNHIEVHPNQ